MRDELFKHPESSKKFEFNEAVANVFEDMLSRSIPFYQEVLRLTGELTLKFCHPGSVIYDLGCSTGTLIHYLADLIAPFRIPVTIKGIDSSQAMLDKARSQSNSSHEPLAIEWICGDIQTTPILKPTVIILNYTLQFVSPETRQAFVTKLHAELEPGGLLIMSEKLRSDQLVVRELETECYESLKRRHGYSEIEISRKRQALENVLVSFSLEDNLSLLRNAGFESSGIAFKWHNFATFWAVKDPM
ncbi:MAG: carboxy-S-adenosyl-L-methionine synthase CmoA [SAR324 cluster bacterium]|nr:carboxy-S-adenosyl-L-methionine synthase CmoA [SAR324 cluster bacterium]